MLALTVGAANAITLNTFDVLGTINTFPSPVTISGTVTVDETVGPHGTFTAVNLIVGGLPPFTQQTGFSGRDGFGNWFLGTFTNGGEYVFGLTVDLSQAGTLVGYTGGLFTNANIFHFTTFIPSSPSFWGGSGSFTLQVAQVAETPLPAAMLLFGSGLGLMGLLAVRRKQKAVAVPATA